MLPRGIGPALLAAGLLLALWVPAGGRVVDRPWGRSCQLAWCDTAPAGVDRARDTAADLLAGWSAAGHLVAGRPGCRRADGQHLPGVPSSMVLDVGGGRVAERTWTYPAPAGSFVFYLCWGRS